MLSELLQKLENEHDISPEQGSGIINTIVQHLKEKFPQVGGMIDSALGTQGSAPSNTAVTPGSAANESSLEKLEELAKSKLGGFFGK
jgi:hypothetical protein